MSLAGEHTEHSPVMCYSKTPLQPAYSSSAECPVVWLWLVFPLFTHHRVKVKELNVQVDRSQLENRNPPLNPVVYNWQDHYLQNKSVKPNVWSALTLSSSLCVCRSSGQRRVFVREEPLHVCGQRVRGVYLYPGPVAVRRRQRLRGPQRRGRMQWVFMLSSSLFLSISLWLTL